MRFRVAIAGALVVSLSFTEAAYAFDAADPTVANELAEMFSSFCIEKFPDNDAVAALADSKKAQVMTPGQVQQFLHEDPGHGWSIQTPTGLYFITIEEPPYNTCAVRRMTPVGIPTVKVYKDAVDRYVASKNGKLLPVQNAHVKGPGISDISAYSSPMLDSNGKLAESFILFLTNYHSQVPPYYKVDAQDGIGVEVRMAHQFTPK